MLNVTDVPAYEALVQAVEESLDTTWRARFAKPLRDFWARMATLAENPAIVATAGALLQEEMRNTLEAFYDNATEAWIRIAEVVSGENSEKSFLLYFTKAQISQAAREELAAWIKRNALTQASLINNSVVQEARNLIARRLREGASMEQIARELASNRRFISRRRLRKLRRDPLQQARTIVRTEVMRAHTETMNQFLANSGLDIERKTWITVQDARVRPTHVALHGATIRMDEEFNVGGFRALHPRDGRLPAGETINCRCVPVYWERDAPNKPRLTPAARYGRPAERFRAPG